jgi:phosphoglycerate dehydrogenase-like enzyme
MSQVVVSTKTFATNQELAGELLRFFPDAKLNTSLDLRDPRALWEYIGDARAVIVGLDEVTDDVLSHCPNLEIVAKYGVGLDNVDVAACERRGIKLGWTGGVNKLSVAEQALGFMLMLARNLYGTSNDLKAGKSNKNGGFQLSGSTIGIIGVGHVGKELIRLLKPFGCRILVNDVLDQDACYREAGVTPATKEQIYREAELVSLHVPLEAETHHLINAEVFGMMRADAYLVNTSRGPVVDLMALEEALKSGRIAGAAIDVYDEEPPKCASLLALPNLINTPHIAGNSKEAVIAMGMSAVEHLKKHFNKG